MTERVARAIQAEMRQQGVLYEFDGEDLTRLMMSTGAAADLTAISQAAIDATVEAIKESHFLLAHGDVKVPTTAEEAEMMSLLGEGWLKRNAAARGLTGEPEDPPAVTQN